MFGSTIAGRPLVVAEQIDTMKYAIKFDGLSVKTAYHLSLFILPNIQFDPNYTALIYYQFQIQPTLAGGEPNTAGPLITTEFRLLGGLDAEKQSAIFKINPGNLGADAKQPSTADTPQPLAEGDVDMDMDTGVDEADERADQTASIVLGISIEPNEVAVPQLEQLRAAAAGRTQMGAPKALPPPPAAGDAFKVAGAGGSGIDGQNLTQAQVLTFSNKIIGNAFNYLSSFADANSMVSMSKFNDWWDKFKSKMSNDPEYLSKLMADS